MNVVFKSKEDSTYCRIVDVELLERTRNCSDKRLGYFLGFSDKSIPVMFLPASKYQLVAVEAYPLE